MPDGPTPPNGSFAVDTWKARWFTSMAPAGTSLMTRSRVGRDFVNRYADSGLGRALTKPIASSRDLTVRIGRIGPKISFFINDPSLSGVTTTVGWMRRLDASHLPPTATSLVPSAFASEVYPLHPS